MVEIEPEKKTKLQQFFLTAFKRSQDFGVACNALLNNGMPEGSVKADAEFMVAEWMEFDLTFKVEFERVKLVLRHIRAEKAEDFLNSCGQGKQKTGKEAQIFDANIKAAHMVLDAYDPATWSSKKPVEGKKKKEKPTRIEYSSHVGRVNKEQDGDSNAG